MASSSLWQRFQQYFLHVLHHLATNDSRVQISKGEEAAEDKFAIAE
jgi:hypothetical protein